MSLDGLVVRAIVRELQSCLGGRIGKIYQPSEDDIVFHLRAGGGNKKLLLSANPTYPRVHWTERTYPNPPQAPMLCMLLRKHYEGGTIEGIEQLGMERIIRIHVKNRDELGDVRVKSIVVELMGRHSNIILLDPATETIIDGIHHVTPAISSYRVVMPGSRYTAPPVQNKLNPLQIHAEEWPALWEPTEFTVAQWLVERFSGLSPLASAEIAHRGGLSGNVKAMDLTDEQRQLLAGAFMAVMSDVLANRYVPNIVHSSGKSYFSVIQLTFLQGEVVPCSGVSECLELFYGDKAERDRMKQRVGDLLRFLQNEKAKNIKKLEKLKETAEEAKDADRFRIFGELITASMYELKKGDKEAKLTNYYDEAGGTVTVTLDPLLTPSENAQRYFRKYVKSKNSLVAVAQQMDKAKEEIIYLDGLLHQIRTAGPGDIEEIREELAEQGYIRDRRKKARKLKKKAGSAPQLACYTSAEGIPIYVGKNNTQNEYLTNRLAQSGDTWLHTKDIPGSHVVIRSQAFGEATLDLAAQLSAWFSQARESSLVPVDYTLIRHVRKPNGAKPGFVIYDHQKTVFVTPNKALIEQLPVQIKG
jgi:predicted ribosome quality control (RQC) complex YloA/Tae2 family protein